ncbi:MAG: glycerate kinase [Prevotella sp.]|nr:glycerate kinase [Prevotella sp.]
MIRKTLKIVVAIDSFKGCLSSKEANQAAIEGIRSVLPDAKVVEVPVSDGGEGFVEAFHSAIGGRVVEALVRDPLMRPVVAKYLLKDKMAVMEMAQASGLTLLTEGERNPMVATSYGTGQLVADAVRKGVEHIVVGLGGSATSDAGIGMLRALIDDFVPHGKWDEIEQLKRVRFTIATDVRNPLCGENGAARVFAPQKGATDKMVCLLDERARRFSEVSAKHFGYDRSQMEGAGAAGGLGYAFLQYMDADCKPGIQLLLETINYEHLVKDADLIVTGEGTADLQTLMGKLPVGILRQSDHVPVCLIAGRIGDREELLKAGFARVECINPSDIPLEVAMRKDVAQQNLSLAVSLLIRAFPLKKT